MPNGMDYDATRIDTSKGERWFSIEAEAVAGVEEVETLNVQPLLYHHEPRGYAPAVPREARPRRQSALTARHLP